MTQSDALRIVEVSPQATMVANITRANTIPDNCFDCLVFVQMLYLVFDLQRDIATPHRILKPRCTLLLAATFFLQGISTGELNANELDRVNGEYQVLLTVLAVK